MRNKHIIVSCTRNKKEDTLLYKCHQINKSLNKIDIFWYENNNDSLSKCYNKSINEFSEKYEYIHFIHDDVFIYDDINVIDYILSQYSFDIVGVAGSSIVDLKPPYLWHLMGQRGATGSVEHTNNGSNYLTSFGDGKYKKAIILDGVYICINTKTIKNWRFDENFDFHFYDIASCISAFKSGLNLGVVPIHIKHESKHINPLTNSCWIKNNIKFEQLYVNKRKA